MSPEDSAPLYVKMMGGRGPILAMGQELYDQGQYLEAQEIVNKLVLAAPDDPKLPDGEIDLVFSSNTYHHIENRTDYFRGLRADLAPGGRLAIVDYDGSRGWLVRLIGHYSDPDQMLREMREAGYEVEARHDFLDRQSFVVFTPE